MLYHSNHLSFYSCYHGKLQPTFFPLFTSTSLIGGRGPTLMRLREVEVEAVANAPYIILAGHPPAGTQTGKGRAVTDMRRDSPCWAGPGASKHATFRSSNMSALHTLIPWKMLRVHQLIVGFSKPSSKYRVVLKAHRKACPSWPQMSHIFLPLEQSFSVDLGCKMARQLALPHTHDPLMKNVSW